MATAERRVRVKTRIEYSVPTGEWGSTFAEVSKAYHMLLNELREAGILAADEAPADDLIRVLPGDDEVVVFADVMDTTMLNDAAIKSLNKYRLGEY